MAVQVYGCNHIVIEVTDAKKAVKFYSDVFGLTMLRGGEGAAWCKLGEHQFMAIFEVRRAATGPSETFWFDGSGRATDQGSAEEAHQEVQAQTAAELPLRLPRSLGEPYSGRRSQR